MTKVVAYVFGVHAWAGKPKPYICRVKKSFTRRRLPTGGEGVFAGEMYDLIPVAKSELRVMEKKQHRFNNCHPKGLHEKCVTSSYGDAMFRLKPFCW